jgi:hypothetical protein
LKCLPIVMKQGCQKLLILSLGRWKAQKVRSVRPGMRLVSQWHL